MSTTTVSAAGDAAKPKRAFRRRYSVARGNAYQLWGLISGSGVLAIGALIDRGALATMLMLVGLWVVYLNCLAIAHYVVGRLVGLRFRG